MSYLGLTSPVIAPGNGTVTPATMSQGGPSWDSSGNVTVSGNLTANGNTVLGDASTDTLNVGNGGLVKDASGNLGLGVTPSAWGSPFTAIDMGNSSFAQYNGATTIVGYNSYADKYKITGSGAGKYQISGAVHSWAIAGSGTAGNPISFTTAMTLGSAGLLTVSSLVSTYTTAQPANMYANPADGSISRSTSALKYKQDIRDLESVDINLFRPVRYKSKCEGDDQTVDHFGLIADEVETAGITELVSYGLNNEVEGFKYERLTVVLLKAIQEQQAIITQLTARIEALENK